MSAKPERSDDPQELQRQFILAREAYEAALDQNTLDRHAGRVPSVGEGAVAVLAKRLEQARAAVEAITVGRSS